MGTVVKLNQADQFLANWDKAIIAINNAASIDETKVYIANAKMHEELGKLIKNNELVRKAQIVKKIGERKFGEFLSKIEKVSIAEIQKEKSLHESSDPRGGTLAKQKTVEDQGVTERQARGYQALAKIPESEFKVIINKPEQKLSTKAIVETFKKPKEKPTNDQEIKRVRDIANLNEYLRRFERDLNSIVLDYELIQQTLNEIGPLDEDEKYLNDFYFDNINKHSETLRKLMNITDARLHLLGKE